MQGWLECRTVACGDRPVWDYEFSSTIAPKDGRIWWPVESRDGARAGEDVGAGQRIERERRKRTGQGRAGQGRAERGRGQGEGASRARGQEPSSSNSRRQAEEDARLPPNPGCAPPLYPFWYCHPTCLHLTNHRSNAASDDCSG
ncbi:hypothetical protein K461DRAFT_75306 [Myriangium duriaei CBS 260.36]|uniref:Uncharacterized protein n=1 Tax=Myriangium duriaei CBS 260.36 TaxID=1168546 RepID=A0A9P4MQE5_9PEZI|nr:hypothetical protein K461DRAFT_75306 [Myriangium duriaei CBS 260.36]